MSYSEYLIWKLSHVVLNIEVVMGEPAFVGGKNQFEKDSFYIINRRNDGFIWPYLYNCVWHLLIAVSLS